jgi:hypothetical protein
MASSWESHKDILRTLYIDRDETLKSIMTHMKDVRGFTKKYGIWSVLRTLSKQLILPQQRSVRAAVQKVGLQQEQHSTELDDHRPQGHRAEETRQDKCGLQRWQGNF